MEIFCDIDEYVCIPEKLYCTLRVIIALPENLKGKHTQYPENWSRNDSLLTPLDWFYVLIKRKAARNYIESEITLCLKHIPSVLLKGRLYIPRYNWPLWKGCQTPALSQIPHIAAAHGFCVGIKGMMVIAAKPLDFKCQLLNTKHNYS